LCKHQEHSRYPFSLPRLWLFYSFVDVHRTDTFGPWLPDTHLHEVTFQQLIDSAKNKKALDHEHRLRPELQQPKQKILITILVTLDHKEFGKTYFLIGLRG